MLGRGSYGSVSLKGGEAVKTLYKVHHLLQEWIACYYLRDSEHVVKVHSFNLESKELRMKAYDTDLDSWLQNNKPTESQKWEVFKCILKGLSEIHSKGLVHGDLKPDNILLTLTPLKAVIGDLGFTSLAPYAKVRRTARPYRDWEYHPHPAHDINSLGIVAMRIFAGFRPRHQSPPEAIADLVQKRINDPKIRDLILRCTQKDYLRRPSADQLLSELFHLNAIHNLSSNHVNGMRQRIPKLTVWMSQVGQYYGLNEMERGCDALAAYLSHNLQAKASKEHCVAMLIILSSLFGKGGLTLRTGTILCKEVNNAKKALLQILESLIRDPLVISGLLSHRS